MQDRTLLRNGKSSTLQCPSTYSPANFEAFLTDLKAGNVYIDVIPNNDLDTNPGVSVVGTALNKANLLTDSTATDLGIATATATPEEAFGVLAHSMKGITVTLPTTGWSASAPYVQAVSNINIRGVKAVPVWTVDTSAIISTADKQAMISEANCISIVETTEGQVTVTCLSSKPSVNITLMIGE